MDKPRSAPSTPTERKRVLLVDDHALFREGLAMIIAGQPDLEVVGEAGDGLEAIVKAAELRPDLVLLDIQMPGCDGLEAARQIKQSQPGVVIVMLTVRDDEEKLFAAIKYGAQGYLLKNMRSQELIAMLRAALAGEPAITPRLAGRMLEEFRRLSTLSRQGESGQKKPPDTGEAIEPWPGLDVGQDTLSPRELDVLALVARGLSDKEIAHTLSLSVHTVKTHLRNILAKLHVAGRREAARLARQQGLI
jgi:DNA-binding NarL/FixJ family response regulator